ncbi:ATP-dependent RNA helicase HrpA [Neisseria sp. Ec49-e6-T10]|uniref:ATP-dependent RNA helicase HrpA n=1 Tax=Neisseria sp. Ec49-e6-T10 TaxID=3140744 RepID=UPI003EC098C4
MNLPEFNLDQTLIKDRFLLKKALKKPEHFGGLDTLTKKYQRSHELFLNRAQKLPVPDFDDHLPINQKRDEIAQLIQNNQVVIICGETGSGKTTQIPKICLSLGRGVAGLIGHTQPRRLAARSVANRIAQELGSPIGQAVGFKVRFTEQSSKDSYIKLMTDGILLAETQTDRYLNQYDTIIIDEAHERSLNIDFLLGYLKKLLPKRPDLKVIITSATINAERFSEHFNHAPVIEVSGRTYPVEILYRPLLSLEDEDDAEAQIEEAIVDAAQELSRMGSGDILVFLPGEREIRETADALRKSALNRYDILPLFARLSNEEQQRIFKSGGNRRIILATNVAETSLTVPGIHYVIDTGLARIKRYSTRAKVEQLHIEKISQAAAKQRSGRCGRVASGVCIRLYDEQDFLNRSAFTDPEIIRSNLAAVILKMASLRLGEVKEFPFLEVPAPKLIADGYQVLHELGAVTERNDLTALGKELAKLPIDPKIGRMLLAAKKHLCVKEMLILVSALSIQDPRERPFDAKDAATKAHEPFQNKDSDFLSFLDLWAFFQQALAEKTSNRQLINLCHKKFISYLRMREWKDLHFQLKSITEEMGFGLNQTDATEEQIHRALLSGLIGNIGMKSVEGHDYLGARGIHFYLFPNSGLFKAKPKWVMAAQLTETTKLYARTIAKINPEWVEAEAPHLVKYHYFDPHWEKSRGEVVASERVTLYGLTVIGRRPVSYGKVAPEEARELFIRGALVEQNCQINAPFFKHNHRLIKEISELEHKSRKQDVLVDDEAVFDFYNQKLPETVCTLKAFEKWRETAEKTDPKLLFLNKELLMQHAATHITEEQFPATLHTDDGKFKLSYRFEPKHPLDGVTLTIPLTVLNRLNPHQLEWLVPGMIREKLSLLIKALPKQVRRNFVPIPHFITDFLCSSPNTQEAILPQLTKFMQKWQGAPLDIDVHSWQKMPLPEYCYLNIKVVDDAKHELAMGRNLSELKNKLGQAAQLTFRDNSQEFEREHIKSWDIGTLPEQIQFARGKQQLMGYLGLQLETDMVALRLFDTAIAAEEAHRKGVVALMKLQLKEQVKDLQKGIVNFTQIAMQLKNICSVDVLKEDIAQAIFDRAFIGEDALPRDEKSFKEQINRARSRLPAVKQAMSQYLSAIASEYYTLTQKNKANHPLFSVIQSRIAQLIYPHFVSQTPWNQLPHMPRYIKALSLRIEKYPANAARDKQKTEELKILQNEWQTKQKQFTDNPETIEKLQHFKWDLEELNVSLFAQELKTPYPVSTKRLTNTLNQLTKHP